MARLFLINHPVKEPTYKFKNANNINILPWNTNKRHWRKFIQRDGLYLDNGIPKASNLCFWGEYEVYSNATIMNATAAPYAIHYNLLPARHFQPIPPIVAQNTDPYVYGCFRYICCRRGRTKHVPGDFILFGIFTSSTKFEFDTVLVVNKQISIKKVPQNDQYYYASILPTIYQKPNTRTFIDGIVYSTTKPVPYYSFVPCIPQCMQLDHQNGKIANETAIQFQKPVFSLEIFNTSAEGQTSKIIPLKKGKQDLTPVCWNEIINAVNTKGLVQGIYVNKIDNEKTF